ncbi:MAG: hypothetical protein OHK0046_14810 [Anaerolineae bacterium]
MPNKTTQRLSYVFGITMAVLMGLSLVLPALTPQTTTTQPAVQPTATSNPVPTFPPPLTDFSSITFEQDYLHPSGLFSVGVPSGWSPNAPVNNASQAQISFGNPNTVSVVETYIVDPAEPITDLEQVSNRFDAVTLRSSWSQYSTSNELSRRIDEENERVLIDFELTRSGQEFLARHAAWTDGNWIYVARVVVPRNAQELLFFMLDEVIANFNPNTQFEASPLGWVAYYDETTQHIIRHPVTWRLTQGGNGVPAIISSAEGGTLQVAAEERAVASEDEARAWVEALRSGIEVLDIQPATRTGAEGYSVAFSFTDPDGESQSGLAVLLNDANGLLHSATLLLPEGGVNLNTEEGRTAYPDAALTMDTFSMLTGLNLEQPAELE